MHIMSSSLIVKFTTHGERVAMRFFIWGNWSDYGHLVNIYLFLGHLSLFDNLLSPVMCCPFTISHFKLHLESFSCALYACSNTLYTCCVHYI